MTIKVLIADDHAMVREGLRHILDNARGFEVAGEASDGASTLQPRARPMRTCSCSTCRCPAATGSTC